MVHGNGWIAGVVEGSVALPIFRIRSADDHFRNDVVGPRFGDRRVDNLDDGTLVHDCLFHVLSFSISRQTDRQIDRRTGRRRGCGLVRH